MSLDQLVKVARRYHPDMSGLDPWSLTHDEWIRHWQDSPETKALDALLDAEMPHLCAGSAYERWMEQVVKPMKAQFAMYPAGDATAQHMPCAYAAIICPPGKVVAVCRSILAPIYWIYETHQGLNGEQPLTCHDIAQEMSALLEPVGLQRFPDEWAKVSLPGISVRAGSPGATLADALFSQYRY